MLSGEKTFIEIWLTSIKIQFDIEDVCVIGRLALTLLSNILANLFKQVEVSNFSEIIKP